MAAGTRFGRFEFDPRAAELRHDGSPVRLQGLPLRLLEHLLEHRGELVTRTELQKALWPGETFGAFEDGLNTAMHKLRESLDDDPSHPRFIETVPRRGYRWIARLEAESAPIPSPPGLPDEATPTSPETGAPALPPSELRTQPDSRSPQGAPALWRGQPEEVRRIADVPPLPRKRWRWPAPVAVGLIAAGLLWYSAPLPPPRILRVAQVTTRARIDTPVRPISDGERIFYIERDGDHWDLLQTAITGGDPQPLPAPGPSAVVADASLRSARLLLGNFIGRDAGMSLWTMPIEGGAAVELSPALADGGAFSPGGGHIAYVVRDSLWVMDADGANPRKLRTLPDRAGWLSWSPDGERFRFTMNYRGHAAIWQASSSGQDLHVLLSSGTFGSDACCGAWTANGRYYVFTARRDDRSNLWALRDQESWWRRSPRGPFQLTHGPDNPAYGTPALRGDRLLYYNGVFHSDTVRVNPATGTYAPEPNPVAGFATASRDRAWIAVVDPSTGALMRSRPDGSQRLDLVPASLHPTFPRWSSDGRWIVFGGFAAAQPPDAYIVPSRGLGVAQGLPLQGDVGDPDWAPNGVQIVVSRAPDARQPGLRALEIFNLKTRRSEAISGSQGLDASRWSYDGRFISATTYDQHQLKLYDIGRRQWRVLAQGNALGIAEWSPDSRYLYYQDLLGPGQRLMRYDTRGGTTTLVTDFTAALHANVYRCAFFGIAPDGSPIMRFERGGLDLFAATMLWP